MTSPDPDAASHKIPLSALLQAMAADTSRERISVSDLLEALGDRALAAMLIVFALPNVPPMPPGTSALLGAPLVFLAAQMALDLKAWLPRVVASRSMSRSDFTTLVRRISPWMVRAERLMRPRATLLASGPMESVVGALCLLLSIMILLPIPLGNMLPALAICLLALGILERDGLWVLAGIAASVAATVLVSGVVFAMAKAAIYFVTRVLG
ncbi:exopolysaccharide biosynthesis protein [uncultured Piscinibacter sp.]|uniref:exopolysaccharide biosynthesis protein n=1 Tax=uncultured Piscinibacter sp. TaxID=1131835 RepID=UPI00260F2CD7|nr:exopolysaccharide biosynthesis protein [uncultured Piscinibacter sp.]